MFIWYQSFTVTLPADIPANLDHQLRFRLRQGDYTGWPHSFYIDNVTVSELTSTLVTGLQPDVVEYHDYDPFGMLINQRTRSESGGYRYGFQGQEKDNELKGEGNSLNYTFRMHDPRVGRFFAVDPLTKKYPHYTPYSFSGNKVIAYRELEGLEDVWTMTQIFENGAIMTSTLYKDDVNYEIERANYAKLANINIENLPTNGVIDTQVNYDHSGSTVLGTKNFTHPGVEINSDQRNWGEIADDWIISKMGTTAHEGEDWINSFNAGGKASIKFSAQSFDIEGGIYSTNENAVGLYARITSSQTLKGDKKGLNVGQDILPSAKFSLFAKANTGNSFNFTGVQDKTDVKAKVSVSVKTPSPINITADGDKSLNTGKTNYSFGIEAGNVSPKVEGSVQRSTTRTFTSGQINL